MSIALLVGGFVYFAAVASASPEMDQLARPGIPTVTAYTAILIFIAIVGHIVIAFLAPKEADAALDERERRIFDRAGHLSGYVFGICVVMSLGLYLLSYGGDALFYAVFGSLMLSQLAEYAMRIYLYRTEL